jgi:hypothetical protein
MLFPSSGPVETSDKLLEGAGDDQARLAIAGTFRDLAKRNGNHSQFPRISRETLVEKQR